MLFTRSHYHILTLLCYAIAVFAVISPVEAHIHHRDRTSLKRLLRKRSPQASNPTLPTNGGATPTSTTSTPATSSTSSSSTSPTSTPTSPTNTRASQTQQTTPTSSSGSTTASESAKTKNTDSTPQDTASASPDSQATDSAVTPVSTGKAGPVTFTASVDPSPTSTSESSTDSESTKKSTTLTVVIVIGSSVAAVAVLWTVFRKWKLGRSSRFDRRLNPINWDPAGDDGEQIPGAHRRHSGTSFSSVPSHAAPAAGYAPEFIAPLPEHDFTAGPAAFAPVGGYADLARASGPPLQMHQANIHSMPATSRYDVGVPLHHQAAYVPHESYDPSGRI